MRSENDNSFFYRHDNFLTKEQLITGLLLGLAYFLLFPLVFAFIFRSAFSWPINSTENQTWSQFLSGVLTLVLMIVVIKSNALVIAKDLIKDKTIGYAMMIVISTFAILIVYGIILNQFAPDIEKTTANQEEINSLLDRLPVVGFLFVGLISPVIEEFIFRYFLFNSLRTRMNHIVAIIITSSIFAILHFMISISEGTLQNDIYLLPSYLLPSFIFTYAYYKTDMLAVPMLAHIGYNMLGTLLQLFGKFLSEIDSSSVTTMIAEFINNVISR